MDVSQFLQACAEGDLAVVDRVLEADSPKEFAYAADEAGRNGLHLAVLHGHWALAMGLMNKVKISPHRRTADGDCLFHSIARGLSVKAPAAEDFQEYFEANRNVWSEREASMMNQAEELRVIYRNKEKSTAPLEDTSEEIGIPNALASIKTDAHLSELFGEPKLTLAKYVLLKYNVVLNQPNNTGQTAAALASELGHQELHNFYAGEASETKQVRRFLRALNEDLVRKIVSLY